MNNAVPVALVFCPQVAGDNGTVPTGGLGGTGGPRREQVPFLLLLPFADRHRKAPSLPGKYTFQHTVIIQHKGRNSCLDNEFETDTMKLRSITNQREIIGKSRSESYDI